MSVLIGYIIVLGAVLGGFALAGGQIPALIQPAEFLSIGGAAFGALVVMAPPKTLMGLLKGLLQCFKGTPYNKPAYEQLFKAMYDLFRAARRDGLISLETHVSAPKESAIFQKYPKILSNHHVLEFICGAILPVIEGAAKPEQLHKVLDDELHQIEQEHHEPMAVLGKTADALPGFGIVAAVMGIVITMKSIDGPIEVVGEHVGAALVGTFLGILLSYGFLAPIGVRLETIGGAEVAYFKTIAVMIEGFVCEVAPKIALENARRGVMTEFRPTRDKLDEWLKEAETA